MTSQPLEYETPPCEKIGAILEQLKTDPANLEQHQSLWHAALVYKAAGGKPLSKLATIRFGFMNPTQRLLYFSRIWAFDASNLYAIHDALVAALNCEHSSASFHPLVEWLEELLTRMQSGKFK